MQMCAAIVMRNVLSELASDHSSPPSPDNGATVHPCIAPSRDQPDWGLLTSVDIGLL